MDEKCLLLDKRLYGRINTNFYLRWEMSLL